MFHDSTIYLYYIHELVDVSVRSNIISIPKWIYRLSRLTL